MSEQITALLAKLQEDADFREKLQGATDLDAAEALVKEAGFDVTKADWLRYQENESLQLADEELAGVAGGVYDVGDWIVKIISFGMLDLGDIGRLPVMRDIGAAIEDRPAARQSQAGRGARPGAGRRTRRG